MEIESNSQPSEVYTGRRRDIFICRNNVYSESKSEIVSLIDRGWVFIADDMVPSELVINSVVTVTSRIHAVKLITPRVYRLTRCDEAV